MVAQQRDAAASLVEAVTLRAYALISRDADLMLIRWIDRRKAAMPADLAAFATVERDARLMRVREVERRYHLEPYERGTARS